VRLLAKNQGGLDTLCASRHHVQEWARQAGEEWCRCTQMGKVGWRKMIQRLWWHCLSADHGNMYSQFNLGIMYKNGQGGL